MHHNMLHNLPSTTSNMLWHPLVLSFLILLLISLMLRITFYVNSSSHFYTHSWPQTSVKKWKDSLTKFIVHPCPYFKVCFTEDLLYIQTCIPKTNCTPLIIDTSNNCYLYPSPNLISYLVQFRQVKLHKVKDRLMLHYSHPYPFLHILHTFSAYLHVWNRWLIISLHISHIKHVLFLICIS